jgi:hypothetical protein
MVEGPDLSTEPGQLHRTPGSFRDRRRDELWLDHDLGRLHYPVPASPFRTTKTIDAGKAFPHIGDRDPLLLGGVADVRSAEAVELRIDLVRVWATNADTGSDNAKLIGDFQ